MPPVLRALLIDDERIARAELRRLLAAHPEIEIVGEARHGPEALQLIETLAPDVIFLDVQMPGMTGFEVLDRLDEPPQVIFTTAFDQHALQAFDANALDYLLKPVAAARLAVALEKLRPPVPDTTTAPPLARPLERVFVRDGERCWLVTATDIVLLESEGNYTRLYFGANKPLIPRSLSALEERLDRKVFFRANRQHIVNLGAVEAVHPGVADNLVVSIRGGRRIDLSRRQSLRLREFLSL
ncbi:MAG TPA: response regulator [Candidatus Synoicihabitans sp.]|nr:response regulator [Candidatus Synoicihabitans sp.]